MSGDVMPHLGPRGRVVFDCDTGRPGHCVVIIAGLHGDEHSGVEALDRVAAGLAGIESRLRGRVVGLLGNISALGRGRRYLQRDLNRHWFEENIAALAGRDSAKDSAEDREQRELLAAIESITNSPDEREVFFLDLHSTSAQGRAFTCMPDTIANLRVALTLPIPAILGLEESINGPLLGLLSDRGYRGIIVEGGFHDDPKTANVLEASIWILMTALGCFAEKDVPGYAQLYERLVAASDGLPRVLEIKHRHDTHEGDGFVMRPGYEHYDVVARGEVLARDTHGEIVSPRRGRMIMPAYRAGTDQGFFIAKDVSPLFVSLLILLRRMRLDRFCHWLPGARYHPDNEDLLLVSSWVPSGLVNVIRLLGWRRARLEPERTILRRRRVREKSEWGG